MCYFLGAREGRRVRCGGGEIGVEWGMRVRPESSSVFHISS